MKLQIKATGFELSPALRQLVETKLGDLAKFLKSAEKNNELVLRVEIGKQTRHHNKGPVFYAEANLDWPNNLIRIEETDEDLRVAIETLKDRLKKEILRFKERLTEKR